jgi:16S rRNA (adenine1518-N6/adenine1519-N6)-dimethyltransferase
MPEIQEIRKSLENLPPINEVLKKHGFYTKRSLGQNFIFDLNLTNKIVRSAGSIEGKNIIEIGPGAGSLTRQILYNNPNKIYLIEKDSRCIEILTEIKNICPEKVEIIEADALSVNYSKLASKSNKASIISNLPYNVGTQLLMNWLNENEYFESFILMFQKEVADRICANVGDSEYGRLAIISDLITMRDKLFEVPPTVFYPPPKIYSAVVSLKVKDQVPSYNELKKLSKVTKAAFSQRRKTIRNSLKNIFDKSKNLDETLDKCLISPNDRAEKIAPKKYLELINYL